MLISLQWNCISEVYIRALGNQWLLSQSKGAFKRFKWLLGVLADLYKMNFRLISQEVNAVYGPHADDMYNFVEVVFMKDEWLNSR